MRVKFGVAGLDKMLNGGLMQGKTYLLVGDTGAGKTILALHFLLEGLKRGENCLYIAVDSQPSVVLQKAMLGFEENLKKGAIPGKKIAFIHTGGIYGTFAFTEKF